MKRFLLLFLVLILTAAFASTQDIGLSASLEFGIAGINKPNDDEDIYPYLWADVAYENSFLDEALDISAELAYDFTFTETDDEFPQNLYFNFSVGYNIGISDASTLSIILGNEDYIVLSPSGDDNVIGIFKPGIKFNQSIENAGECSIQLDVPIAYLYYGEEKDYTFAGLDITIGYASEFGLGLELGGHILFSPDEKEFGGGYAPNGFTGISLTVSYETGPFYAEIAAAFPVKNLDNFAPYSYFDVLATPGVSITPQLVYNINESLSAYVYCIFDGIGIKDYDMGVSPAIGITYSF